jgi:pimeloyl-[acyl-carrier protein] methyl ester esterase
MKTVFLHALPFDGRMWDETVAAFDGETFDGDTLAPDLFTLGDSVEAWAAAVVDLIGSEQVILVGCSVGGSCALEVARAAPKQVEALVLIGAKAGVNPEPDLRDEAVRVLETEGMAAAWDRYWRPLFADTTAPTVVDAARALAMSQPVASVVNGVRAFHDRRDLSAFAATWDGPLIGISGDRDYAPGPSILRALATGDNRMFHLVENCGHYVNLEQPAAFGELLEGMNDRVIRR